MKTIVLLKTNVRLLVLSVALTFSFSLNAQTTSPELVFNNSVLQSGTAGLPGAIYKFPLVNQDLDALVKIIDRSSASVELTSIDLTTTGFGKALQPRIRYNGNLVTSQEYWMEFEVVFLNKNTTIPATINSFNLTALDIDGDNSKIKEWDAFYNPASYTLEAVSSLSVSNLVVNVMGVLTNSGKTFTAPLTEYPGIDTMATNVMTTLNYINKNSMKFRLGGTTVLPVSNPNRMYSLWFKGFTYEEPIQTVLPLKLVSFTATLNQDRVNLAWTTTNEVNVSHFIVERSTDGINFTEAGLVFAYGNTTEAKQYQLPDNIKNIREQVIYYRLRSHDVDGKTQLSATRIIRRGSNQSQPELIAFPNPVQSELRVSFPASWQNQKVKMEIFRSNGQLVRSLLVPAASQTESINLNGLANGMYIIRATQGSQTAQQSILKQ